jgi:hypothetical protein
MARKMGIFPIYYPKFGKFGLICQIVGMRYHECQDKILYGMKNISSNMCYISSKDGFKLKKKMGGFQKELDKLFEI